LWLLITKLAHFLIFDKKKVINSNLFVLQIKDSIKTTLKNLPNKPGVYRYYDTHKNLLYIGKAKSLKNRVSSYFQDSKDLSQRIRLMVSQIETIEYSVVTNEKEAILMEANLIYSQQPRYNILLKDDKNYTYVRLTEDPIPGFFLTRRKFDPKSRYFGPFTQNFAITDILRTLRIIFPFCQEREFKNKACNYVSIKQCDGICCGLETLENYTNKLEQIENILDGHTQKAVDWIKEQITYAVTNNNFALAGLWRDKLQLLEQTITHQKVVLPVPMNVDLATLILQKDIDGLQIGSIYLQNIRDGKIVNVNNFLLSGSINQAESEANLEEIAFSFWQQFMSNYRGNGKVSDTIGLVMETFGV
jgi:excinuclease ABC subunit C